MQNNRTRKKPFRIAIPTASQGLIDIAAQASTQSNVNGTSVTRSSRILRAVEGSRYLARIRTQSLAERTCAVGVSSEDVIINALAFGECDNLRTGSEVGIFIEFIADGLVSFASIVIIDVDEMEEDSCAVDMTEKIVPQTFTFGGALD